MINKRRSNVLMCAILIFVSVFSQNFSHPKHGIYSEKPASDWQDAMLSGNGTIGILVLGKVNSEEITLNHSFLYLPNIQPKNYVNQGTKLDEIRNLLFDGNRRGASNMINTIKNEAHYNVSRDSYILLLI